MRGACCLSLMLATVSGPVWGDGLSPTEQKIVGLVDEDREWAVDLLARSVNIMSATENHEGVRRLADLYATELESLGFTAEWIDQSAVDRAGHLVAERAGSRGKRLLLIGHLDTVLEGETFRREGSLGYGSGTADMKSGNAVILAALRALHRSGELDGRQVIVIFTGDEEATGKPYSVSRAALVDAGKRSDVALAFEGSVPGTAVVGRRGFSSWMLLVEAPVSFATRAISTGPSTTTQSYSRGGSFFSPSWPYRAGSRDMMERARMDGTKFFVSLSRCRVRASAQKSFLPVLRIARTTFISPALYPAIARYQSPNIP